MLEDLDGPKGHAPNVLQSQADLLQAQQGSPLQGAPKGFSTPAQCGDNFRWKSSKSGIIKPHFA